MLAIPSVGRRTVAFLAFVALTLVAPASQQTLAAQDATTAARESALKAFTDRVDAYVALKKKVQADLPKPKPGDRATGKVEQVEDTLASRLKAARSTAKAGDIFGDAGPYFKRIIEHDTETRGIRDAYATMQEVPAQSPPAVNAIYPEKAALATVPPLILVNLPRLPDGLEYRFIGRDLILRDRDANIIVDFLVGAVPVIKR